MVLQWSPSRARVEVREYVKGRGQARDGQMDKRNKRGGERKCEELIGKGV